MKKLMKYNKRIIGVAVIILAITVFFSGKLMNNVVAAGSKCNNASALQAYYKMAYDWSDDDKHLTFTVKNGVFRVVAINHPEYFTNSFVQESNGYYKIDGGAGVLKEGHNLVLNLRDGVPANAIVVMKLALSETDTVNNCLSMAEFNSKKSGATFDTGNIEIELPKGALSSVQVTETNTNYNGLCVALREGRDPTNSINTSTVNYMQLYNSGYAADYRALVPGCWQANTTSNYTANDLRDIIRMVLSSTYEKHHMSVGEGDHDEDGSAWMINFDNVKEGARRQNSPGGGHWFYTDNNRKFYTNQGGALVFDFENNAQKAVAMKCNVKAKSNLDYSNLLEKKADGSYNIDANIQYYYAYNVVKQQVHYVWKHTAGSGSADNVEETKDACSRTCEEAVEVKYGPPIASKAGLCFEYQVQVTSRVKCTSKILIEPPTEPPVCNPIPYCNSIPGHIHQAGANDDYKACIKSCDGGKYTKKCSEKCYKEVYGSKANSKIVNTAKDVATEKLLSGSWFKGHYKWSGGSIVWVSEGGHSTYSRYYRDFGFGPGSHGSSVGSYYPVNGFKKRILSNSPREYCHDHCKFKKCSKSQYLNRFEAQRDYKANLEKYNAAISECKASATCTTKTASFTISADYINGKNEVVKIDYPYTDPSPEKIGSAEDASVCQQNENTYKASNNIILNYAGCYKGCNNGLQYHTRWSFPGSWINVKTGALSFKPENGESWTEKDDKFCMPFDAKDVNAKWWSYFYGLYDNNHITSYDNPGVTAKCVSMPPQGSTISEAIVERWNINASTKNFGYFGWNFDISCFYALNSKSATPTANDTDTVEKCDTSTKYRIRTVDLKNLFPATDGGTGTRQPGFNWSGAASVLASNGKNAEYESMPSLYAEKVQSLGYNVYKEDNLDYQFTLTKEMLKRIKDNDRNHAEYKGNMVTQHGMYSYKSDAIRNGAFTSSENKVLNSQAIGCNNVQNYRSTSCSDIQREGE